MAEVEEGTARAIAERLDELQRALGEIRAHLERHAAAEDPLAGGAPPGEVADLLWAKRLHDLGVLDDEEYRVRKRRLLARDLLSDLLRAATFLVGLLAVLAAIVAVVEAVVARGADERLEEALAGVCARLDTALEDDLGAPVVTARLRGLVELVHELPAQRPPRRWSVPALLLVAGAVAGAGAAAGVVDRVERRRERVACVQALGGLALAPAAPVPTTAPRPPATAAPAPVDPLAPVPPPPTTAAPVVPPRPGAVEVVAAALRQVCPTAVAATRTRP